MPVANGDLPTLQASEVIPMLSAADFVMLFPALSKADPRSEVKPSPKPVAFTPPKTMALNPVLRR